MNEQELIILFSAMALQGLATQVGRHSSEFMAQQAVELGIALLAQLKAKNINWPEPFIPPREQASEVTP